MDFIGYQLERVLGELRSARVEMDLMHSDLALVREEVRITRAAVARLEDTMQDVLGRIRLLEQT
jgi:hypothetical protein